MAWQACWFTNEIPLQTTSLLGLLKDNEWCLAEDFKKHPKDSQGTLRKATAQVRAEWFKYRRVLNQGTFVDFGHIPKCEQLYAMLTPGFPKLAD